MSSQLSPPTAACRSWRRRSVTVVATVLLASPAALPALAADPSAPQRYTLTELGAPGTGTASFALGLSPQGEVVGTARTSPSNRPQFATRWSGGQATSLGSLPGSTFSRVFAQNAQGVAVGEAFTASPEVSRAVSFDQDGTVRDLGALGSSAVANDINARGTIVGSSMSKAVVFGESGPVALPPLDPTVSGTSRADAINDRGQVAGFAPGAVAGAGAVGQAALWTPFGRGYLATGLDRLAPGRFARAYDLNAGGTTVGEATRDNVTRAVRWDGAAVQELPGVDDYRFTRANAVSNSDDIVGHATGFLGFATRDGAAVLWRSGVAYDLNDFVDQADGFVLRSAEAVDERGRIVGFGTVTVDGQTQPQTRGFLLTPVTAGR